VELAWKNPANLCTISEGVKHLPKNALYLIVDNHSESADYDAYVALLETMDLTVESISRSSPGIEEYSKYFEHPEKHFSVSERERHPSALANRMIADYLYRRITTDDAWRFVEQ
jgi:hypothetical protein